MNQKEAEELAAEIERTAEVTQVWVARLTTGLDAGEHCVIVSRDAQSGFQRYWYWSVDQWRHYCDDDGFKVRKHSE